MTTDLRIKALELAIQFGPNDEVVARADAYLNFLLGGAGKTDTPPAKTTTVKKTEEKPKAEEPKADTVEVADQPETEAASEEAPAVEYADVKRCILGISSKLGRDVATKLLGEFGVEKGPDLKPADYAAFVAKAEPMLEKANG